MRGAVLSVVLGLVGLSGCVDPAFVRGEREVYKAVAPEYLDYVRRDARLSRDQVLRRERTVRAWEAGLKEAESE